MEQSNGASAPIENSDIRHEAAGNLAFLMSVIRCREDLNPDEETNVRRVIAGLNAASRAPTDTDRINWIEKFIETGMLESCFELDGGIHVTLHPLGEKSIEIRERNSFREAIDEAMKRK